MSFQQMPPPITREMEEAGQVWVRIHDAPATVEFYFTEYATRPGHWEVRATGAVVEDRDS